MSEVPLTLFVFEEEKTNIESATNEQKKSTSNPMITVQPLEENNYDWIVEEGVKVLYPNGAKTPRRKYTVDQVHSLFKSVFIEQEKTKAAAEKYGINPSTANQYISKVRPTIEQLLPLHLKKDTRITPVKFQQGAAMPVSVAKASRGNQKLFGEHSKFLISYFEDNESATLKMAATALCDKFDGLAISTSGLHKHLTNKCSLVIKTLPTDALSRLCLEKDANLDGPFDDYIFVGAVDYLMYVRHSFGWVMEPVSVVQSGILCPTLVAFSKDGVLNLSVVSPAAVLQGERKKDQESRSSVQRKLTLYTKFLETTMNSLQGTPVKSRCFVTNDRDLYCNESVHATVSGKGYKLRFEQRVDLSAFWQLLKSKICRSTLEENSQLVPRMAAAAKELTAVECQHCIDSICPK